MPPRISITFWNRLEPRPRGRSLRRSLAAEIRDPLWLLTRQWQLGEFQGQDAASPRSVAVETETIDLDRWQIGGGERVLEPEMPLEREVLSEPYVPDLSMRVELAEKFLELIGDAFDPAPFLDHPPYQLPIDNDQDPLHPVEPASQRFGAFMKARLFDGFALYLDAKKNPPPIPGIGDPRVGDAARALRDWVDKTYGGLRLQLLEEDPSTWRPERLEHQARLGGVDSVGGSVTFVARPDGNGDLDWDGFELAATTPGSPTATRLTRTHELQPTHVRFPGMPNARFWDFEEGTMSFADVEPDNRDLAKMMLVEFALVQGDDWFYFDLPQRVGTLCRIRSLVVKDVFGGQTGIERAQSPQGAGALRWALFQPSRAADAAPGTPPLSELLVVPATSSVLQQRARAVEEVLFARDEMANLAWAIERATPSPLGEPWPGQERDAAMPAAATPPPGPNPPPLTYEIMSRVPVHWTPLLPARVSGVGPVNRPQIALLSGTVERAPPIPDLIRGKVLRPDDLASDRAYVLHEEEVPRAGVQVRRMIVRSRWTNGTSHLWFGRARATGRGETGSGLRFDSARDGKR